MTKKNKKKHLILMRLDVNVIALISSQCDMALKKQDGRLYISDESCFVILKLSAVVLTVYQ